jgi:lipopolysaccharide export system protein LptC
MNSRITHALPLILMLLLGGLTLWLQHTIQAPEGQRTDRARHEPDSTVEQFTVTRFAADGRAEAKLSAERLVHYADDDSTELAKPHLVRTDDAVTVTVHADRGMVTRDYEHAYFYDNVEMQRRSAADEPLEVRSQYVHVLMKDDVVRSDRAVTITQGESRLSGVGFEYDRQTGRLSLLSSVKASFSARHR